MPPGKVARPWNLSMRFMTRLDLPAPVPATTRPIKGILIP